MTRGNGSGRSIEATVVNGPLGDPVVHMKLGQGRRVMLFDLGDIAALGVGTLLRVSHVFVSHMHVDHFIGFDQLLRLRLQHTSPLLLFGPAGSIGRVEAKLRAYTWNLLDQTVPDFVVTVREVSEDGSGAGTASFSARDRFARRALDLPPLRPGIIVDSPEFIAEAAILDHGTDCVGYAVTTRPTIKASLSGLDRLGLARGPWIKEAKTAILADQPDDFRLAVDDHQEVTLGALKVDAFSTVPGRKIAYVVDVADTAANRARVVVLACGADQLFIETAFADEDEPLARARRHLTAGAAGRLARAAAVRNVTGLHVSNRYASRLEHIQQQFDRALSDGESARNLSP